MNSSNDHITEIGSSIKSTLNYFGLFKYPLTSHEIHRFLSYSCEFDEFLDVLRELEKNEEVFISDAGFYSFEDNPQWSTERLAGNQRAETLLYSSSKYVRKISNCPFVSSVAISGSLSKYYADEKADIDYFIITKTNRLWIARTLLHFYKKFTFITGKEHYYCMNYFIDESALEIDQKNIYSAIETVTLIPSYNKELIIDLKELNGWVMDFLPNETYKEDLRFLLPKRNEIIKHFFENILNLMNPYKLNRLLMNSTDHKWRRKWRKRSFPMDQYDQALFTSINISKNHPANYQSQILSALETKAELTSQPPCEM